MCEMLLAVVLRLVLLWMFWLLRLLLLCDVVVVDVVGAVVHVADVVVHVAVVID